MIGHMEVRHSLLYYELLSVTIVKFLVSHSSTVVCFVNTLLILSVMICSTMYYRFTVASITFCLWVMFYLQATHTYLTRESLVCYTQVTHELLMFCLQVTPESLITSHLLATCKNTYLVAELHCISIISSMILSWLWT